MGLLLAAVLAAAPAQTSGLQEDFNAASATADAGDCTKAVPLFEALEHDPKVKPGNLSTATISVRKGVCLVQLARTEEGEAAILAGLPRLERAGGQLAGDIATAYHRLGDISLRRVDYAQARQRYEQALHYEVGLERLMTLGRLAKATAFDPGPEPLAFAEEGIKLIAAEPKPSKDQLAQFHALHARILLNRGQYQEAYAELKQALSLSGGLTTRTSIGEAAMRGDLALAALQLGKKEDARLYLAYTGAGRIEESPFASAAYMVPPECGDETGLKPEDLAVIEFAIDNDGSVTSVETIFSHGGPRVAAAFAKAVREWYWNPQEVAKIPAFYRLATRVELRCSTAGGPAPSLFKPLEERFAHWAQPILGLTDAALTSADSVSVLQSARNDREAKNDAAGQVAATGVLAITDPRASPETLAMLDKAILLAGRPGVSGEVINTLRILRFIHAARAAAMDRHSRSGDRPNWDAAQALLKDPALASDALALDTLKLALILGRRSAKETAETSDLLRQVADDERLGSQHALRQVALLKLANVAASSGNLADAQAYFARTGLSEQQCALIGAKPTLTKTGAGGEDYPMAALQYGFEGWVKLEFDITAAGRVADPRPVIAYPPNVFVDAATGMARDIRYEASYRPSGGGLACSANSETIRFVIPERH